MSPEKNPSSLQEAGTEPEAQAEVKKLTSNALEAGEVANLLEGMETLSSAPLVPGEVVQGKVLKVTDSEVLVDISLKSEVAVPRSEFLADDGRLTVASGDTVDVWIEHYDELSGTVSVSHQKAVHRKVWDEIERAFQDQTSLRGRVVDRIKGGLAVDVGARAFLPASHADSGRQTDLEESHKPGNHLQGYQDQPQRRNNVVVSRKLAMEEER